MEASEVVGEGLVVVKHSVCFGVHSYGGAAQPQLPLE